MMRHLVHLVQQQSTVSGAVGVWHRHHHREAKWAACPLTSNRGPLEIDTDPRRFRGRKNGGRLSSLPQILELTSVLMGGGGETHPPAFRE